MLMKKEVIFLAVLLLVVPLVFSADSDRDGIPDDMDKFPNDFDNDGMPDEWELRNGLRVDVANNKADNDNDGLSNYDEFLKGTDPNSADSDGDGVGDYTEIEEIGTNPLVADEEKMIWPLIIVPFLIIAFIIVLYLMERHKIDEFVQRWLVAYKLEQSKKSQEKLKEKAIKQQKKIQPSKSIDYDINKIKRNKLNDVPQELHGLVSTLNVTQSKKTEPVTKLPTAKHKRLFNNLKQVTGTAKTKKEVFENLKSVR